MTATALSLSSSHAETIGDPPGGHAVWLVESPPSFGSCPPPISAVNSVSNGRDGAEVVVSNRSTKHVREYLTFDLSAGGRKRLFWTPIDLPPGSSVRLLVHYLTTLDLPVIGACAQRPGGIVDGQEPVLIVVDFPPDGL